jgi:S-adenosylmethionine:tRNA ribosyltransferase-isomerase
MTATSLTAAPPTWRTSMDAPGSGIVPFDFVLPPELEAGEPPEARGLGRDDVRLLVSSRADDRIAHARFRDLPDFLTAGDLVVINTSGTLNAAVLAARADGSVVEVHLSTRLPGDLWAVELRTPTEEGTEPLLTGRAGETLRLPACGAMTLLTPYRPDQRDVPDAPVRLWFATLSVPEPLPAYLERHGFPIRYRYVNAAWPLSYYQTVYATEPGSAEMPSAGRAFTPELITRLVARGIQVAPLILHTGVASLEAHEPPYEEYYRVPPETAAAVNATRARGGRVIAVGTTVVRALETVADADGTVHPGEGWTTLIVTPERGVRVIDTLLTGFHEPQASHLAMLEAIANRSHLHTVYDEALRERYLWHEFGDLHLLLP